MRIKYTEFALNPALRGTISHLPQHRAQALIDSGAAVELPYKNHVEYLNDHEAQRQAAMPKSAPVADQWGVKEVSVARDSGAPRVVVFRTTSMGETLYYDAPPKDAPQHVIQRYRDVVATDSAQFSQRAEFLKQQHSHHEPSGYPAQGIALTIIGANGVKRG